MALKTVLLATPADPGDNDAGQSYPRATIRHILVDPVGKELSITIAFGDRSGEDWVDGPGVQMRRVSISGDAFEARFDATISDLTNYLIANNEIDGVAE